MSSGEIVVKSRLRRGLDRDEVYLKGNMLEAGIDERDKWALAEAGGDGGRTGVAKKSAVIDLGLSGCC